MERLTSKTMFKNILLTALFVCISFANIKAQDPKACMDALTSMNSISTGLPAVRIAEYESCVNFLYANKDSYKPLLQICFNKLITYYGGLDNQTKVNEFKTKLETVK